MIEKSKIWRLDRKILGIQIRNARLDEYKRVETIMKQVQQMHIDWRPDIYKYKFYYKCGYHYQDETLAFRNDETTIMYKEK